jgi:hypothetical protein
LGRKPFYVLLGELLKAVPPRYWNKYIMQLWHDNKDQLFGVTCKTLCLKKANSML